MFLVEVANATYCVSADKLYNVSTNASDESSP
jgi:hypothetical protein